MTGLSDSASTFLVRYTHPETRGLLLERKDQATSPSRNVCLKHKDMCAPFCENELSIPKG